MSSSLPTRGRRAFRIPASPRVLMRRRAIAEGSAVLALVVTLSIAPTAHAQAAEPTAADGATQTVPVTEPTKAAIDRGGFGATNEQQTYVSGRTNADWAKLVLVDGHFPVTDDNVTVLLRWMRQENGPPDWFNRNNPLNLGMGGFATFPDLTTTAQKVADNLNGNAGYAGIVAALKRGDSAAATAAATAAAIWASPWSGSHYANGTHWSTAPVEIVQAPAGAW